MDCRWSGSQLDEQARKGQMSARHLLRIWSEPEGQTLKETPTLFVILMCVCCTVLYSTVRYGAVIIARYVR